MLQTLTPMLQVPGASMTKMPPIRTTPKPSDTFTIHPNFAPSGPEPDAVRISEIKKFVSLGMRGWEDKERRKVEIVRNAMKMFGGRRGLTYDIRRFWHIVALEQRAAAKLKKLEASLPDDVTRQPRIVRGRHHYSGEPSYLSDTYDILKGCRVDILRKIPRHLACPNQARMYRKLVAETDRVEAAQKAAGLFQLRRERKAIEGAMFGFIYRMITARPKSKAEAIEGLSLVGDIGHTFGRRDALGFNQVAALVSRCHAVLAGRPRSAGLTDTCRRWRKVRL